MSKKDKKEGTTGKKTSGNAAGVASVGNLTHKNPGSRFQRGNPHRFRPGQSGNPSGRASAQRAVTLQIVKEALGRVDPKLGTTPLERIIAHTIRRACQGSYKDKKLLLAYGLGQPAQAVDLTGTFSFTDVLARVRERDRQGKMAALPAGTPGNGHSTPQEAQDAAHEDGAAPQPAVEHGPVKRVVVWRARLSV